MTMTIYFNPSLILFTAAAYIVLFLYFHGKKHIFIRWFQFLPVLLHEFGHAITCQLTGGQVKDIVIVTRRKEQMSTRRSGYAITATKPGFNTFATLIAGYMMPPVILGIALICVYYHLTYLFWGLLIFIFVYYLMETSRKLLPLCVSFILCGILYVSLHTEQDFLLILPSIAYHIIIAILFGDLFITVRTLIVLYFQKNNDWDGAQLSRLTRIPVFFYLIFFVGLYSAAIYYTASLMLRHL